MIKNAGAVLGTPAGRTEPLEDSIMRNVPPDSIDEALDALESATDITDLLLLERAAFRLIKARMQALAAQVGALGKTVTR